MAGFSIPLGAQCPACKERRLVRTTPPSGALLTAVVCQSCGFAGTYKDMAKTAHDAALKAAKDKSGS